MERFLGRWLSHRSRASINRGEHHPNDVWVVLFEMVSYALKDFGVLDMIEDPRIGINTIRQVVHSGTNLDRGFWPDKFVRPVIEHDPVSNWIEKWHPCGGWSKIPRPLSYYIYIPPNISVEMSLSGWNFYEGRDQWKHRGLFVKAYKLWARQVVARTPWPMSLEAMREIDNNPEWPSRAVWEQTRRAGGKELEP